MLCCAVLCCAVLCCAVLCCAVMCCAVLCCAALLCPALRCAVLCCACAALCCPAQSCLQHHFWVLQNLDASTLDTYVQQLQDQFSKGSKYDTNSEDQQVWNDAKFCIVIACFSCDVQNVSAVVKLNQDFHMMLVC